MPFNQFCRRRRFLWWFLALVLFALPGSLVAQIPGLPPGVRPTPEQARELLQSRPDLVQQLRARLQASGLTPDQVRARLRAEGYPEDLLDPYLVGADTTRPVTPAPNTLDAVRALGILSVQGVDSLQHLDSLQTLSDSQRAVRDSIMAALMDSTRQDSLSDTLAARRGGLKLFGYELFRRTSSRFRAPLQGPVSENYQLGPGDMLVLILSGDVELTHTLEVTREGFVFIPQVGTVHVANLTLSQLTDVLYSRLGRVYSGIRRGPNPRTRFSVTVARIRNIQIFVTGDVVRAGAYQVPATSTVLTALYEAGGPTSTGSFRRIEVRRAGRLVDSVDVYDYLLHGNDRSDVPLRSGDIIFVPVRGGQVKLAGRVLRPAIYEIRPKETLRDLLAAGGGFDANAVENRIQIQRIQPADSNIGIRNRVVIDVTSEQMASGPPAVPIMAGDSVTVFETPRRMRDYVSVRGNVWIQGRVGYVPGLKLSEAIRLAGGPKPDVYLGEILVSRVRSDSSRIQLRSSFADSTGRVTNDLVLDREDEIQVFSRAVFRTEQYVTVVGAVRRSGRIPYREGMTLRDAVLLADGVTEDADLSEAEIARLPAGRPTGALAQTIRVQLDSSYLFDGTTRPSDDPPKLQPHDNILVLRQPGWAAQRLIWLTGQVKHPGRYALTSKTERLADLIVRAGGLTDEAYPGGVAFYRRAEPRLAVSSRPVTADTSRNVQPMPAGYKDRVGIDLPEVLRNPGFRDNIILASGDSIHVPEFDPVVTVLGAVNAPGPVAFTPGKNLDWYVSAAGGYAQNGDKKIPYVTQPDGKKEGVHRRFLLSDDQPKPLPGAVIFVPTHRPSNEPSNLPAVLGVVTSILASLTTVVVVLTR